MKINNIFSEIYDKNLWNGGSGPGSNPEPNKPYISLLESFFTENKINSIVDAGCGDWRFSKLIDWNNINYKGYDVVKSVIDYNQVNYSSETVSFQLYNGDPKLLPSADLLIMKDVLQHLSFSLINEFILGFPKYKYCLITNCINTGGQTQTVNRDIETGGSTELDLRLYPFNLECDELLEYWCPYPHHRKLTLLINNTLVEE